VDTFTLTIRRLTTMHYVVYLNNNVLLGKLPIEYKKGNLKNWFGSIGLQNLIKLSFCLNMKHILYHTR